MLYLFKRKPVLSLEKLALLSFQRLTIKLLLIYLITVFFQNNYFSLVYTVIYFKNIFKHEDDIISMLNRILKHEDDIISMLNRI